VLYRNGAFNDMDIIHFNLNDIALYERYRNWSCRYDLLNKSLERSCIQISERGRNPSEPKYDALTNREEDDVLRSFRACGGTKKAIVILNVGRRKQGKSTTASMESLCLCKAGCKFAIGTNPRHQTFGVDCSPPLQLSLKNLHPKPQLKNILGQTVVIVDIEGLESQNKDEMMLLLKHWVPIASIVVHVSWPELTNEDYFIAKQVHDIIQDAKRSADCKYMVSVATTLQDITGGEVWRDIKQMVNQYRGSPDRFLLFHKLPELGEELWKMVHENNDTKKQYPNLFEYMSEAHCQQYLGFARKLIENVTYECTLNDVANSIIDMQRAVDSLDDRQEELFCIYCDERLQRERMKVENILCNSCDRPCHRVRFFCPSTTKTSIDLHPKGFNLCDKCKDNPSIKLIKVANDVKNAKSQMELEKMRSEIQQEKLAFEEERREKEKYQQQLLEKMNQPLGISDSEQLEPIVE